MTLVQVCGRGRGERGESLIELGELTMSKGVIL